MPKPLDPKTTLVRQAKLVFQIWHAQLPSGVTYGDLYDLSTWSAIEKFMRPRGSGNRKPKQGDIIRCVGVGFDVMCVVARVSDGYVLSYHSGQRPAPSLQALGDLEALPEIDAAELKTWATKMRQRWQTMGVTRDDLERARRQFAKRHHPDAGAADGRQLATVNALVDRALETATVAGALLDAA